MARELTSHRSNGLNDALAVLAIDGPGAGNASHHYAVSSPSDGVVFSEMRFQNGPISEAGVNGVSNEALLAIVEDRLAGFQSGPFACRENAIALTKIQEALLWLHKRTRDRVARGVEGTNKV